MKNILLFLTVFIGLTLLDYCLISIYYNDFNLLDWSKNLKILFIFLSWKNLKIFLTALMKVR